MQEQRDSGDPAGQRATASSAMPRDQGIEDKGLLTIGFRQVKRMLVLLIGGTVLLVGVVMLVVPGPGLLVIPVGLGILAVEFAWARRLLRRFKEKGLDVRNSFSARRTGDVSGDELNKKDPP
jgi:Flp pilus assembly protein TadB